MLPFGLGSGNSLLPTGLLGGGGNSLLQGLGGGSGNSLLPSSLGGNSLSQLGNVLGLGGSNSLLQRPGTADSTLGSSAGLLPSSLAGSGTLLPFSLGSNSLQPPSTSSSIPLPLNLLSGSSLQTSSTRSNTLLPFNLGSGSNSLLPLSGASATNPLFGRSSGGLTHSRTAALSFNTLLGGAGMSLTESVSGQVASPARAVSNSWGKRLLSVTQWGGWAMPVASNGRVQADAASFKSGLTAQPYGGPYLMSGGGNPAKAALVEVVSAGTGAFGAAPAGVQRSADDSARP